jgi:4-amino-4-deoxy-L-arabinose transferase-like glycosyltransferase
MQVRSRVRPQNDAGSFPRSLSRGEREGGTLVGDDVRPTSPALRFELALVVIALVGLVGRIVYVIWMRDNPTGPDAMTYHGRALALADGRGYVAVLQQILFGLPEAPRTASQPPGWSGLLAVPSLVGLRSILSHQVVAGVIGSATIVMTGLAGRAAFGRRAGLIAAGVVAVYPNVWLYERELMSEPLALLLVATCIWLSYRFLANPSTRLVVALGIAIGSLAMTRADAIVLLLILVVPVVVKARGATWRRHVGWLVLAAVGCVLPIVPWVAYNATTFEHPVLLSTGLGTTMLQGNCDATYSGELLGYYQSRLVAACTIEGTLSDDPTIADGQKRRAAIEYMKDHLARVPVVAVARIGRTFSVFRPFQQVHLESERGTSAWVLRAALFSYWALVPLAVAGVVLARRRRIAIYPLLALLLQVLISVAFTIGAVRYRAPTEIPLALLAAFAIAAVTTPRGATLSGLDVAHQDSGPGVTPPISGGSRPVR